ncbi:undecaprenyl phosphate translocase family protein [Natranaerobius thermophilus]|uniref:DUF368 domain-containing protein n=1 Tax=Natranaerobius thermophilus (strain ATCC BAA-1301 / DSM 18059 / JW/NM-WN-LF) TaxID=457570 RepID=B2A628_NATTJ|nr:DUF368 domain-containing protein [Natranaerobius thermophilus]ACB85445.1 protein of unknown function DUF368 [Natranaerobius thermophilus JW/NM-WN-LF]
MLLSIKGLILGFIMVLPGMSGGSVFVIFGMYEQLIKDLVQFKIKPYMPLMVGMAVGIFLSGLLFSLFFENYRDETAVFLLGCLLASVRALLRDRESFNFARVGLFTIGIVFGLILGDEPMGVVSSNENVSNGYLFMGGAFSSATMILPGLPGSSVLIAMGIYDTVLFYLRDLVIGKLFVFGVGGVVGISLLVKLLEQVYNRYKDLVLYFFSGLIIGSARALLPYELSLFVVILFITGFIFVWTWSGKS